MAPRNKFIDVDCIPHAQDLNGERWQHRDDGIQPRTKTQLFYAQNIPPSYTSCHGSTTEIAALLITRVAATTRLTTR